MLVHVFDVRVPLEKEGNELFGFEDVAGQLGGQHAVNLFLFRSVVFSAMCIDARRFRSATVW